VWPRGVLDRQRHYDTKSLSDVRKHQIGDLTEAIRLAPNDFYTYFDRAHVYEEMSDSERAISDYTDVIRLVERNQADIQLLSNAFLARAWLHGKKDELDGAIADYTEVIRLRPFHAYVRCCRAGIYAKKGELDKAIADYTEAVQLKSDNAYIFIGRARLYAKKGDFDKVVADCTEATRLKPDFAAAYNERASAAIRKGSVDAAIADATEAIRLNPKNAAFYHTRSLAYVKKGDKAKASEDHEAAIRFGHKRAGTNQGDASVELTINDLGELVFPNPTCSKYVPSIDNGNDSYRFPEAQLKQMARTRLDQTLFLRYMEAEWPLSKLKAYCTPKNRFPEGCQNLVPENDLFGDVLLHVGKKHEFDKIYVYVCEDDGKSNYFGSLATDWRRWDYSLNVVRGKDHWAIVESLPNDFMDNPAKYLPGRAVQKK
jgi:tetratricopeptide (TPR) repeat protein